VRTGVFGPQTFYERLILAALRPKPEPERRVDGMRFAGNVGPLIPKVDRDRLALLGDSVFDDGSYASDRDVLARVRDVLPAGRRATLPWVQVGPPRPLP